MNTIEVGNMAPSVRRKGDDSGQNAFAGYVVNVVENLIERTAYAPKETQKRWAFRSWSAGGPSMFVDLDATGETTVDPRLLHHATWYHSTLRYLPADLESTFADIDVLQHLKAGWNGYDVAAPKIEAIHDATSWIEQMYEDVMRSGLEWRKPHVAADEHGDVTFEWWHGDKGLTIYVSAVGSVSYLKDWGPDMVDDMEVGPMTTSEEHRELWAWFLRQ